MNIKNTQIIRIENGKQKLLNIYDDVEHGEEDGTFAVQKNGLWGFIDTNGNEIITPQYEDYDSFNWINFFYSLFFTKPAIYGVFTHKKRTYSLGSFLKLEF